MRSGWSVGLVLIAGACGVDEGLFNARVNELNACKVRMDGELAARRQHDARLVALEAELARIEQARAALDARAQTLSGEAGAMARTIDDLKRASALAEQRSRTFRQLAERLRGMVEAGKLQVVIRKGRMVVKLSDRILFDAGRTDLKPGGEQALAEVAHALAEIPDRDFLIAGHTDADPIRSRRYRSNWELSTARAVKVVEFLARSGVAATRLGASGFAETDPIGDNATAEGKAQNRRIEIVVMPNLQELPSIVDAPPPAPATP